jgi:short-subunit dehydrogenase involved in D-alanine esterification of teichoic acids
MAEMNINVGGVIRTTSAFIDVLTANKGAVINVSSALAFVPLPSAPIYCASKARSTPTLSRSGYSWRNPALRSSSSCPLP